MTAVGEAHPRYAVFDEIGAGGMATVHLGRQLGAAGFAKTVAVKRLRPQHVRDAEFVAMFADEARLAARVRHPNVAATLDVVCEGGELFLVLEYVHGESLDALVEGARALGERPPPEVASALIVGALAGLHAAHVATADDGAPLDIVHRDVSPQNVLVGADGVARLIDFGIAKASVRLRSTRDGKLKGKLPYMAPEQLEGGEATAPSDVYAAGALLWELLAGERLFRAANEGALLAQILEGAPRPLAAFAPALPPAVGAVVARALARDPRARFASAREMAVALELALPPASPRRVGEWVERVAGRALARRAERIVAIERETARAPEGGAARVTLPPGGPPGARPQLTFSAPPPSPASALAARAGPRGETMTLTAPRGLPRPAARGEPPAAIVPGGAASARRRGRAPLAWALVAVALAFGALPFARRGIATLAPPPGAPGLGAEALAFPPAAPAAPPAPAAETGDAAGPPAGAPRGAAPPAATPGAPDPPGAASADATPDDPTDARRGRRSAAPARAPARWPGASRPPARPPSAPATPPTTPAVEPPAAPAPSRPLCDPPYYVDASGIRRVKRDCL